MEQQRKEGEICDLVADEVNCKVPDEDESSIERRAGNLELLKRLRKYRGRMPEGFKFDRLEAHERG